MRVNVGCGQTPCKNWKNYDNSIAVRLSKIPLIPSILLSLKIINKHQYEFMQVCRTENIEYGNMLKRMPIKSGSVEVLYSSHVLEHQDREASKTFLNEAYRILKSDGIIRIAVPDLKKLISKYLESGDADNFIDATYLSQPCPNKLLSRLRFLLTGIRHHQWMYDGNSLCRLLKKHGFINATVVEAGLTSIPNPESLNLKERVAESVYVEAKKP